MAIYLTKTSLSSYCGDILPLRLLSDTEDLTQAQITWEADPEMVLLRSFDIGEPLSFRNGVLLTLLQPGTSTVTATLDGRVYTCTVTARAFKTADPALPMHHYIGDLHTHAGKPHVFDLFANRESGFPSEIIRDLNTDGRMDFGIVSDHACLLSARDFFRGFTDEEDAQPMELVMFPGSESEVSELEYDRYGVPHKNSGEVVILNADQYASTHTWDAFWDKMELAPYAVGTFAHPQTVGSGALLPGIWNFRFHEHNSNRMRRLMRLTETGKGHLRGENLIHEYAYSLALDSGFRVSPTSSSDCHGPVWGYDVFPGKTVIMAQEKSREAFLDAIRNNRVYATASGNVKLHYTVNGTAAPADLANATEYKFHVEVSSFHEDPTTVPVICQVISDQGICVKTIEDVDFTSFDFTVTSDTAHYFYLRLSDPAGRKTWSAPVWTGRAFDLSELPLLRCLDKAGWKACEIQSGTDAAALIDDNPHTVFVSDGTTATFEIDLGQETTFCALGHYPEIVTRQKAVDAGITNKEYTPWISQFAYGYRITASADGETFAPVAEGVFRSFGGEEVIRFPRVSAQYLRLEILSTVGKASLIPQYADARVSMAELSLFDKP